MGQFHVAGRVTGSTGQTQSLDFLVDTGATLLALPRSVADALALRAMRSQRVVLAGGTEEVWPISEVKIMVEDREVTTPCFITPGGPPLLGAVALESLFLGVDPVAKRLVPVKGYAARAMA
jgi:clan AA aspartic protease